MKIRSVKVNNRKKVFEVATYSKKLALPYAKTEPAPTSEDPVVRAVVDKELAREEFVFTQDERLAAYFASESSSSTGLAWG